MVERAGSFRRPRGLEEAVDELAGPPAHDLVKGPGAVGKCGCGNAQQCPRAEGGQLELDTSLRSVVEDVDWVGPQPCDGGDSREISVTGATHDRWSTDAEDHRQGPVGQATMTARRPAHHVELDVARHVRPQAIGRTNPQRPWRAVIHTEDAKGCAAASASLLADGEIARRRHRRTREGGPAGEHPREGGEDAGDRPAEGHPSARPKIKLKSKVRQIDATEG
jgi:hypothetical protein